jgi:hypothetical protein
VKRVPPMPAIVTPLVGDVATAGWVWTIADGTSTFLRARTRKRGTKEARRALRAARRAQKHLTALEQWPIAAAVARQAVAHAMDAVHCAWQAEVSAYRHLNAHNLAVASGRRVRNAEKGPARVRAENEARVRKLIQQFRREKVPDADWRRRLERETGLSRATVFRYLQRERKRDESSGLRHPRT